MAETINVKIAEIVIPERWRKKETDVTGLANSILELSLLNPIGITKHKVLIHGFRRITAYKILGRDTIPAIVFDIDENDRGLLDPYLGVGTTAVVCERLQRRWVGIEIDPKTAALASERIKRIKREEGNAN
jgi:hypothetical protein